MNSMQGNSLDVRNQCKEIRSGHEFYALKSVPEHGIYAAKLGFWQIWLDWGYMYLMKFCLYAVCKIPQNLVELLDFFCEHFRGN